jgi:hypothetical protein
MADIENPWGDYDDEEVAAQADTMSGCLVMGCVACLGAVTLAVSWALATLSVQATATSVLAQALAGVGAGVGLSGLVYGCTCCIIAGKLCLRGNQDGKQQEDQPLID